MLNEKQIILLFLISSEPGIKDIYTLVRLFDNADFPSRIMENLNPLLKKDLITAFRNFDNGTVKDYRITENGKKFLAQNLDMQKILEYIKTLDKPELLLKIVQAYFDKVNGI